MPPPELRAAAGPFASPLPEALDGLLELARSVCEAPMAALAVLREGGEWWVRRVGNDGNNCRDFGPATPEALLALALQQPDTFLEISDLRDDTRLAPAPLSLQPEDIVSLAVLPLRVSEHRPVGVFAILDTRIRSLTADQSRGLRALSHQASCLLELREQLSVHAQCQQRFEEIQSVAQVGSWELDVDSNGLYWSEGIYRIFGVSHSEFQACFSSFFGFVHPDDREGLMAAQQRALAGEAPLDLVHRILRPNGEVHYVRERATLLVSDVDQRITLVGTVQDVTDEHNQEQALRKQAHVLNDVLGRLSRACRLGQIGAWEVQLPGLETRIDEEIYRILGLNNDGTFSLEQAFSFFPPPDRQCLQDVFASCCATGEPYDETLQIITCTGERRWTRSIGEACVDAAGTVLAVRGAFQDITDLVEARQALEAVSKRLEITLECMSDAFYILDLEWRFVFVNAQVSHLLRHEKSDLLGTCIWDVFPQLQRSVLQANFQAAMHTGCVQRFEFFDAGLSRWFLLSAHPSDQGLAVYFRDVTEQRVLAEQYKQVQRLESLGQLTGGVAHDFNNLLTVILGNAELLSEQLEGDERLRRLADMIRGAAQRSAELTQRLLAFARKQPLDPRPTDLNRLIHDLEPMLRRSLGEQVEVELVTAVNLWPTLVDPGQMESGLVNLAVNARDALPKGGRLTIETSNTVLDAAYVSQHADVAAGPYVMVAVSDTGEGIPASVLPKVFDPFFTTKEKGKGTGLGLATLYGFVKQSRGHVVIESEVGHGTTVTIYLPRLLQPVAAPSGSVGSSVHGQGHGELVLVVEDDAMVRKYATGQLESLGYRVLEAGNGAEGLAILRERQDVQLLFTDVVMPGGMSGQQLAEAALELHPSLPVLYTSGYAEDVIVHNGRLDPGVQLLSKPYRRAELANKVRLVLSAAETPLNR